MESNQKERSTVLSRYFSDIRSYPLLTKEQEQGLARNVRNGCQDSLHELVESNLSFVVKVASEYRNLGLPFEDLLNEGNIGLIEAAHRYDASKGTKFITYAIWWIRKSILKALSEHSSLVRVPTYQMKKVREIRDAENSLRRKLGRKPKREEISDRLERSVNKIDQVLQFTLREMSLDDKVGKERDTPISDYLVDDNLITPEDDLIKREANLLVSEAMSDLTEQERTVLCHRFGIAGGPTLTLKEIGEMMNISRERVRQVECQAKNRLKKIFARKRVMKSPQRADFPGSRAQRRLRG
ncbi:MAG: sigma-70 family RNA polymerase sigma factor [Acidobacteria bacterium]|nr:sigma-70 family RNA polymerase sigma factor [Acidobacteriota bacterium]NIM63575.1 sigma-70 family RNA polymerase sigma factor [Acidobacteriota bacterium]NIO58437.1 sigma-70 family RNA polymerase sigma factor [Acidobacteriota bacterium]NIQ29492.1 sigma-70 family RNA polymerase sigma factor [Acidobacteriota bacterium]NIQ84169.1 sigma-70 family RNA polymerase sigma factor [Acidobacteriota bacterium]